MAETAYVDKYKVYEEACAGCWYHGDEVGSCNLSEPCEKLVFAFASAPAADVAEVVHGCWGDNGIAGSMLSKCSVCGFNCGASSFPYCPECGAKMDGGEDRAGS